MSTDNLKRLKTYDLTLQDLHDVHVGKLHELSVMVGWPHRPDDWHLLQQVGQGVVGCDKIGRIVSSAMWFPMGDDFATIGMVITSPRLQALGAGRWLMEYVLDQCEGRQLRLNATRAAYRLYESLSFRPVARVHQHQGEAVDPGEVPVPAGARIRKIEAADLDAVIRLDTAAYGADRTPILNALLARSDGFILMRDGQVAGFALCRPFGRGHVVGPVVAENSEDAIALIAPFVADHVGHFLRVDTAQTEGGITDFLERCGMREFDRLTTMALGDRERENTRFQTFALAGHTLG